MEAEARINEAVKYVRGKVPSSFKPQIGIVCGSGLGGLGQSVDNAITIHYQDIPGFSVSSVDGHANKLVCGQLEGKDVICMVGRLHFYEGHANRECTMPIRVMSGLGCKTLVVTNASGGINREYRVGTIMTIEDHISVPIMSGQGPLIGPNLTSRGPRFPGMSDAYDRNYRKLLRTCAQDLQSTQPQIFGDMDLQSGVYFLVSGPQYETRAECRMIETLGGDAVGMSTVAEVIVARHEGMKVLGLSLISNMSVLDREPPVAVEMDQSEGKANHEEVLEAGKRYSAQVTGLVREFVKSVNVD